MIDVNVMDSIATVRLCRPPVNAINGQWIVIFNNVLDDLSRRSDWAVLHIRSDSKVFCAGADLRHIEALFHAADGAAQMFDYVSKVQSLMARIEALPAVTLAEISGAAMGGGLELALACDLRIASDSAKLGLPEARLGLLPGAGGTQRLTRLCGRGVANRLILGGEAVTGEEAVRLGIVQWAVPGSQLKNKAEEIGTRISGMSKLALAEIKSCITAADLGSDGFMLELQATRRLFVTTDTQTRIKEFLAGVAHSAVVRADRI